MKKILVLCVLLVFVFGGCATTESQRFLQVDFPDPPVSIRDDGSEYYVVKVTKEKKIVVLGTVEEVYPEVFIDGEGLPLE